MSIPITVIIPTLNEKEHIQSCLESLKNQDYSEIIEILVVDGGSTDGTKEIVEAIGGNVRLLDNPRMTAAAAMNVGIKFCTTDVYVRVDAHTLYSTDYVSRSVASFVESGAQVVGGPMRPISNTQFGNAVAAVTSSPFGIGPGRFHYSEKIQEVETVYLGIFNKAFVQLVGGYDDQNLQWAAEDQELNFRIRKAGGRILLDPRIHSNYFPRDTPRSLARQYHNYGMCKASTLAKHKTLPYWRPLVPALMVAAVFIWSVATILLGSPLWIVTPFFVYLIGALTIGLKLQQTKKNSIVDLVKAISICHWCYGLGFWRGIFRIVTFRKFDIQPQNGRR
jgi:glycosyltransferase involved in cell wall biosynthesis